MGRRSAGGIQRTFAWGEGGREKVEIEGTDYQV